MKIFVTGISGFIGSNLGKFFLPSDEIYALSRGGLKNDLQGVKIVKGDLNDPQPVFEELKKIRPDVCIHLAWEGIPDFSYAMSIKNLHQGTALLRCLVEECGCHKIIVGGSCFEYGKTFGARHEDEDVTLNSYFVWAKHTLYNLGKLLALKYDISFVWFRFFYVYGPGQREGSLIPMMANALKNNQQPSVKTPHNANDFIYVEDIAEALALAVHKDLATGIYNLGSAEAVAVWKVCEYLEKALGQGPSFATQLRASKVDPAADFWADMSKSSAALGWSPKIEIEEGVRRYIKSMEITQ